MENKENLENAVVQTKKKRPKVNIWATITMVVLGLLAISVIIMATVPKNYASGLPENIVHCSAEDADSPNYVYIYKGTTSTKTTVYKDADEEKYNEIMKAFEKGFSQSTLSALFKKELGGKVEYDYIGTNNKSLSNIVSENEFVMSFNYANTQTLTKNGDPYVCEDLATSSIYVDGVITYQTVWVTVNNVDGLVDVRFYIRRMSSTSQTNYAVIQISAKALQSNLANVLTEMVA